MGQTASSQVQAAAASVIPAVVLRGHRSGVTAVEFSPDGAWLASSSLDGTVRLWSTRTWNAARILNHGSEIHAIAFSPDGHLLVSGGYDRRLMFWETKSGKLLRAVKLPDWPNAIAFTPTGKVVAGCADGLVQLLDWNTGAIKRTINTEYSVLSLAVSADGRYLATGIPIKLWNLESGQVVGAFRGAGHYGLTFAPLGEYLASAEYSGGARVWSVPTGELRQTLRMNVEKKMLGPSGYGPVLLNMPASAVAFSRDGTWLATGGTDSAVQLWKVPSDAVAPANQTAARIFTGHTMTVTGVSLSPHGRRLASASLDRTVRVWELR